MFSWAFSCYCKLCGTTIVRVLVGSLVKDESNCHPRNIGKDCPTRSFFAFLDRAVGNLRRERLANVLRVAIKSWMDRVYAREDTCQEFYFNFLAFINLCLQQRKDIRHVTPKELECRRALCYFVGVTTQRFF